MADGSVNAWPCVALGEVLVHVARPVTVIPTETYREIGIRSHGKGIFHKEPGTGLALGDKRVFMLEPGDFVLNIVFAWEGAVALVTEAERGMIGSHRFPAFRARDERLDLRYLNLYLMSTQGLALLDRVSPGGAGRNRTLSRAAFLEEQIPLPPLAEQQRIVARVADLCAKVDEAMRLREEELESLTAVAQCFMDAEVRAPTPIAELVSVRDEEVLVDRSASYPFAGVKSFGRGVFRGATKRGADFAYDRLRRIKAGDLIYPKLMAWEGAFGLVPSFCDGCVVSPEFQVFEVNNERVVPEVLEFYLHTPSVWQAIAGASKGTNLRRQRLAPDDFLAHRVSLPSLSVQAKVREVLRAAAAIKDAQELFEQCLSTTRTTIIERGVRGEL